MVLITHHENHVTEIAHKSNNPQGMALVQEIFKIQMDTRETPKLIRVTSKIPQMRQGDPIRVIIITKGVLHH